MVGCDGPDCTREWVGLFLYVNDDTLITWCLSFQFHLPCTGLVVAPKGEWYCEECLAKRGAQASNKSHRRGGHAPTNSTTTATNSSKSGNGRGGSGGRRTKSNNRSGNTGRAKSQSATLTSSIGGNNGASEPGTSNGTDGPGNDGTPSPAEALPNGRVKDETDMEPSPIEPPEPDKKERVRDTSKGASEKTPTPADIEIDPALGSEPPPINRHTSPSPPLQSGPAPAPAPQPIAV